MATYNGASYLEAQLRSLLGQTFTDWALYVHDDGSTDETVGIVRRFAALDSRIRLVDDGITFHSSPLNFLHLLEVSSAPYAIFCDQDDIWLENKLQRLYEAMTAAGDAGRPRAVYCNSYVYDAEAAVISGSATLAFPRTLREALFLNGGVQGCAVLFNAPLREICRRVPEHVAMHDHLLMLAALSFGSYDYLDMRLMLYRRHARTVTGRTSGSLSDKVYGFFSGKKAVLDASHFRATRSFYEANRDRLPAEARATLEDFFRFEHEGRLRRVFHALAGGYRIFGRRSVLALKLLLRPIL